MHDETPRDIDIDKCGNGGTIGIVAELRRDGGTLDGAI